MTLLALRLDREAQSASLPTIGAFASQFIVLLRDAGLLHTARAPRGRRGGIYVFTELLEVIEGRSLR